MTKNVPPVPDPPQIPATRSLHGDSVADPFAWMTDPHDPRLLAHLRAENAYTDGRTSHLEPLRAEISRELSALDVGRLPALPARSGDWWYITRFETAPDGRRLPCVTRVHDSEDFPRDGNGLPLLEAADRLPGEHLLVGACDGTGPLGELSISPRQDLLARAVDHDRDERSTLEVIEISTGTVIDAAVTDAGPGFAFSSDQQWLFYARTDESGRRFQVCRHRIGTDAGEDQVVLDTSDTLTAVTLQVSRDRSTLVIRTSSRTVAGVWLVDLARPLDSPREVLQRWDDVVAEHAGDRLLIIHKDDAGRDAVSELALDACPPPQRSTPALTGEVPRIAAAPATAPRTPTPPNWSLLLQAEDREQFVDLEAFAGFAALTLRIGGRCAVRVIPRRADGSFDTAAAVDLGPASEIGTVQLDVNPCWDQTAVRYLHGSLVAPTVIAQYDVLTGEDTELFRPQLPQYDPALYVEQRIWADAPDGTRIPISLISHRGVQADGTNPGYLYGYGAHGVPIDMRFQPASVVALNRGVVIAVAHVRGGGELGRDWQEQAMSTRKGTSFTDFLACADHLVATGWVAQDRLCAGGDGAGGLLVGAAINQSPDRFRAVSVSVPTVDPLTTLLDPETTMTVDEWAEWGDPVENPEVYRCIASYAPYENIRAARYPAVLARTSVLSEGAPFQESVRWIARLRASVTSDPVERPILLRCAMDQPGDTACRRDRLPGVEEIAWLLEQSGATALL